MGGREGELVREIFFLVLNVLWALWFTDFPLGNGEMGSAWLLLVFTAAAMFQSLSLCADLFLRSRL